MEAPTPALVQRHTALRRHALLSGGGGASMGGRPPSSPGGSPRAGGSGGGAGGIFGGAPLTAGSRLGTVSSVSSAAPGGPRSDASGLLTPPGARTPPRGEHRRTASAGGGAAPRSPSPLPGSYAVMPVGAGGGAELANNDQVRAGGDCVRSQVCLR